MALDYGTGSNFTVTMEGPFGSVGTAIRMTELTLLKSDWKGAVSPFSQQIPLEGISIRSKVDLLPSYGQLEHFREKELALTTENQDGVLTVYAIGECPDEDLTIQAAVTEVTL